MITYIKGKILKIREKSIIISNNDIGYCVFAGKKLLSQIQTQDETALYIHSHIREDCFDLYGFETLEELDFFKILISVKGIGPKAGLEMLSTDMEKIKSAIVSQDSDFLAKTPGIGKKTAERLILELKSKIKTDTPIRLHRSISDEKTEDIIEALTSLGYSKNEITKTLEKLPENIIEEEEIISFFLKNN